MSAWASARVRLEVITNVLEFKCERDHTNDSERGKDHEEKVAKVVKHFGEKVPPQADIWCEIWDGEPARVCERWE